MMSNVLSDSWGLLALRGIAAVVYRDWRQRITNIGFVFWDLLVPGAYLAGVAFTGVHRTFTSTAGPAVLVAPSTPAPTHANVDDRFFDLTGGVDVHVQVKRQLHFTTGARVLRLRLEPDLRGWRAFPSCCRTTEAADQHWQSPRGIDARCDRSPPGSVHRQCE